MIWTEWGDYQPGETVKVLGDGFAAGCTIAVQITDPLGSLVNSGESRSDSSGAFVYEYRLQMNAPQGEYLVTATDGNSVATVTFMDANDFWLQAANDGLGSSKPDGVPDGTPTNPQIEWVSGDIGRSKEALTEGNIVPTYPPNVPGHVNYRAIFDGLAAGQYKWTIEYQFTKGGKVAFDFLTTSYGLKNNDPLLYNDLAGGTLTAVKGMVDAGSPSTMSFAADTFSLPTNLGGGDVALRQGAHDVAFAGNVLSNPVRSLRIYGATITSIAQGPHVGSVTSDSSATVVVSFTVPSSNSGYVLATWGGHIAIGRSGNQGYGPGNGATGISGSPYHMIFGGVKTDPGGDDAVPKGQHDLSLKAEAVAIGSISGFKFNDLNANAVWDAGEPGLPGWVISISGPVTATATTAADGSYSFTDLAVGTYTVSEQQQPQSGWTQTYPTSPGTWTVVINAYDPYQLDNTGINFGNTKLNPKIDVTKSGPSEAHIGDVITYTITVTNTGDCTLYDVTVIDSLLGTLWAAADHHSLAVGASMTFHPTWTVAASPDPLPNRVDVSGKDILGTVVTDFATWSVDVLKPGIDVTKTGPAEAHVGDVISYTITVTNTGDCPLYHVSVVDSLLGTIWSEGTLAIGESKTFSVTWTVAASPDPLPNTVTATGKDNLGGTVSDSASHSVDVLKPAIDVTKTGPAQAHAGDVITYTITVTNIGDCPLYDVSVVDPLLGTLWAAVDHHSLAVGESTTFTPTWTVAASPDPLPNTVTATGKDNLGMTVTDSASWSVDVLKPAIDVTKTGPAEAHVGDVVTYTITVTNTGDCPLHDVKVVDSLLGTLSIGDLAVGASITLNPTWTVAASPDPLPNTAVATGVDPLGLTVTDTASWSVDILKPAIDVTKTGPAEAHVGEVITYTITVTNTGDCTLYDVSVVDPLLGTLWAAADHHTLAPGASMTFHPTWTVAASPDPLPNTVTATGKDNLGLSVSDSASWSVDVLKPAIDVTKSGPAEAHVGDEITYTIVVTNMGDCPLYHVTVVDSLLGTIWNEGTLAVGESKTFMVPWTVAASPDPLPNTVTVTGKDNLGETVTDSASHSVDVLKPAIDVTKTGPAEAHVGDVITYTIVVKNTGDCPLYHVSVVDSLLGTLWSEGTLAVGESKTFTPTWTVAASPDPLPNTVTATGKDNLGMTVTDSASWSVDVLKPAIDVTKTGPAEAHAGDVISYTIVVTNTGDCPLYDVTVDDTLLGSLFVGSLPIGGSMTFHPTWMVGASPDPLPNTVSAIGKDNLGRYVSDTASWSVDVLNPEIDVQKTGPEVAHEGDTITYTITVTNTGDCPLYNVVVSDTLVGAVGTIAVLQPGAANAVSYSVPYIVPSPSVSDPMPNTATATGADQLGMSVTDSASWSVDVIHPHVTLEKVGPTYAHELQTIVYTISVTNDGDCKLYSVVVVDPLLGVNVNIGDLLVGETKTVTKSYQVPSDTETVDNTALATGSDILGGAKGTVQAQDVWTVDILHPAIDITKTGPSYAHKGDVITYTFTVTNIGDCTLYDVTVTDNVLGAIGTVPELKQGAAYAVTFTKDYTITIESGDITNTVTAVGDDGHGVSVSDSAVHTVHVALLSVVTDTEFCMFDVDKDLEGQQFRLIFTPDFSKGGVYKLSTTNPGQFYYNVFYLGTPGTEVTIEIRTPYPFVTQGSQPVHLYGDYDTTYCENGNLCYVQIGEITEFETWGTGTVTSSGATGIALSDYNPQNFGSFAVISVKATVPDTGLIYVTVHLQYGLKQTTGYAKNSQTLDATGVGPDGILGTSDDVLTVPNLKMYEFSWRSGGGWTEPSIQSENAFKKDPGFAGLVLGPDGTPVAGTAIQISSGDRLYVTVYTDIDGWYVYSWKYTGKPTTVTLKLMDFRYNGPTGCSIVQIQMKSNSMVVVDFNVPSLW